MYRLLHNFALDPSSPEFKAPVGQIWHSRRLADPTDTSLVAMNVDTPYSYAWLDLRPGPVELTMPAHEPDRYMSAMVVDLYTYILGYVSPRTSGNGGETVLIAGPGWTGTSDLRVLRSPTDLCLVLCRTQLFGPDDMPRVAQLQDRIQVAPQQAATLPAPIEPVDVRQPPTLAFLTVLDWMLTLMPPLAKQTQFRAELEALPRDDSVVAGLEAGQADLMKRIQTVRSSAELFGDRQHFGDDDLTRAAGAFLGILGNAAEEYLGIGYTADAEGKPFDGSHNYAITFDRGLPPVGAFWSVTVYTQEKLLYANELNRYAFTSRDVHGHDPLTIHVQHDPPEDSSTWLPCPEGPFGLTFRTYLPEAPIRDGDWTAPPVRVQS
jgi:hypothetical protein